MTSWIVGLDIGSTTVKGVALPQSGDEIAWQDYRRHETRQAETVLLFLQQLEKDLGLSAHNTQLLVTGSGAGALAAHLGARFVQEVNAVALAAEKYYPDVQSVVELGGQDAKMIFFEPQSNGARGKIATMNDQCAGGTGAILDKLSGKLHITADQLRRLHYDGILLHPVAGKCGVFAESDINGLQKQGVSANELMASLFEAIVLQNLSVLTRGRILRPRVLLLGGPNTLIPGMREAWRAHILRIWRERAIQLPPGAPPEHLVLCPDNGVYFAALGAVEFGRKESPAGTYAGLRPLEQWLSRGGAKSQAGRPALRGSDQDFARFLQEHAPRETTRQSGPRRKPTRVFLGVDGGSTSTKAALVDEGGAVRGKAYRISLGNPIEDCQTIARDLRLQAERSGTHLEIQGAAVTGYAKDLLAGVLRADIAPVETVAHARSGLAFMPDADVIVDIGGQDIKLLILRDGHVKDFILNTQCSAGNGYFLQSTARAFGVELDQFATRAFQADRMPEFSAGCAVFLQTDIVNFQRQGWTRNEILAGLAAVLPRNIWQYVAKIPNPGFLGHRFLLQGGTQRNLAVVKAQVDYLRANFLGSGIEPEIVVHEHCGEAGAIGAALEARDQWRNGMLTRFPGLNSIEAIRFHTTNDESTRCRYCGNHCLRTFIDYELDGLADRLIVAKCEKGAAADAPQVRNIVALGEAIRRNNPNLVDLAARTVWSPTRPPVISDTQPPFAISPRQRARRNRANLRIGLPRVFNQYIYGGFFSAYLQSLGVRPENVIWSDFTSDGMYRASAGRGAIDPCFPSKIVLAHVHNLLTCHHERKALDAIFLPMFDVLETHLEKVVGSNACPTTIATPLAVAAAFRVGQDEFAQRGIRYLSPLVDLSDHALLSRQMYECWDPLLGLTRAENDWALDQAFRLQRAWMDEMRARSLEVLEKLELEERLGIVMLGRPYHHDPGLNHGIPEEFQKRGYPVFSQATLPVEPDVLDRVFGGRHPLDIEDVWQHAYSASTTQKVWAAKFVARHPNLIGVEISNFRCGHDAPAYRLIEQILESAGRPYFGFKDMDENRPAGSLRLRIETIDHFLKLRRADLVHHAAGLTISTNEGEEANVSPEPGTRRIREAGLSRQRAHEQSPHDRDETGAA
ncbi:BadF/BadG/BcrA/BcrD ATPase family protein [uncultured Paludibaculum sp.]|uniref:BadF/BadG/BcrA/BcrD ATPase family protein n=1 Tax=uncultured Paludibaculum sp. TaxID=1765020 RepID=UPI002AAAB5D2|nr:BadF/BadG/BcrA/BcrD ATPase family protein [uncultured Paludibaculum sp.]